jgi:GNAT superfamily N-acetyltransferase
VTLIDSKSFHRCFVPNSILIRPFQPTDQPKVKDLILAGLAEHWGSLDPSCNPDLDDITTSYAGAIFLVAQLDGRLVGNGALLPRSQSVAEIVRMSVAKSHRRRGIGRLILRSLLDHAQQAGFKQVILETTATWQEAVKFYIDNGFQVTHYQGGDIYFCLELPHHEPTQLKKQQDNEI